MKITYLKILNPEQISFGFFYKHFIINKLKLLSILKIKGIIIGIT